MAEVCLSGIPLPCLVRGEKGYQVPQPCFAVEGPARNQAWNIFSVEVVWGSLEGVPLLWRGNLNLGALRKVSPGMLHQSGIRREQIGW